MKSRNSLKILGICTLTALTLTAGAASAEGRSCLFDPPARATAPQAGNFGPGTGPALAYPPEVRQQMARIELALRNGQITPFEAGRLMRQQWELAQFRRGFLAGRQPESGGGCGLISPDLAASLAPLGDMAKSGMQAGLQTASTLMRALMQEAGRLIQEQALVDGEAL